ncbi:MAG: PAS domain S-box protein [Proteobacteria bacterium]|nr:PAS domain S-box protein [Pseudomonadota bacterium]
MTEGEQSNGPLESLARQLKEKEAIINGISDSLMLLDTGTYKILDVNQAFLSSYGLDRQDVLGKKCYEITHHLSRPCHHADADCPCPLEDSVATGNYAYVEHVHRNHHGKTLYFEITTYPLPDASGRVTRVIHLSRDITMRKYLENEVKRSENKYRTIFNSIPNPVFVLDIKSMEILDSNNNVAGVYGFSREELVMTSFLNLFLKDERERYASELRTSNILNNVRQLTKEGKSIFVNVHVSPSEYLGQEVLLVTTSDITKRLLAEQQLIQTSKMTTLGEMAASVAHELNQPLSVIKTAGGYLIKKLKKGEEIGGEILETLVEEIDSQVDRASKIINHMREFGRKSDVTAEMVHINDALSRALEIFNQQFKLRGIEVIKEMAENLPPIWADSNRLEQVFINLLLNARDAIEEKWEQVAPKGEGKRIFVKSSFKDGMIMIEVRDTGTGIPESIIDRIFEPFFTTKEVSQGTGLGLSICYSIVQDYHGTIKAETQVGEGASLIIRFPVPDGA